MACTGFLVSLQSLTEAPLGLRDKVLLRFSLYSPALKAKRLHIMSQAFPSYPTSTLPVADSWVTVGATILLLATTFLFPGMREVAGIIIRLLLLRNGTKVATELGSAEPKKRERVCVCV